LRHLNKIEYTKVEDKENFTLHFYFNPNEYFTNSILSKNFFLQKDQEEEKEKKHGYTLYKTECNIIE
jgi:hypothetical protein